MSKKDYEALAGALRATKPEWRADLEQWTLDCESIANALAVKPRFDKLRFLAACGVESVATEAHAIRKEGTLRERLLMPSNKELMEEREREFAKRDS